MSGPQVVDLTLPGKLQKTFENLSADRHTQAWTQLWDQGDSGLWDRGCPSPALVDILEQRRDMFNPMTADGRRKSALVPGCGRGYEVVLLALHGFDAYGLEVSLTAVRAAEKYAAAELGNPSAMNFRAPSVREISASLKSRGSARFYHADFFKDCTEKGMPNQFDLVYDYTFFCALPPGMRQHWGTRMSDLLRPDGLLVCLEFPLYKDPTIEGPPWGVRGGAYWDVLVRGGTGIVTNNPISQDVQDMQCDHSNGKFCRILYIKPERSYTAGKGTDMLSVWRRK